MTVAPAKFEHICQHGGMVTVLSSHGLSTAHPILSSSLTQDGATVAEKAAVVTDTRRGADATAAVTKAVVAVINPDAVGALAMAAARAAAARAAARGAAAREAGMVREEAVEAAAAAVATIAAPMILVAPHTHSSNYSSSMSTAGTHAGTAPRRLGRACSFERKVGQQRRGDVSSRLQRSVSFGRRTPRSSGSGEGGQPHTRGGQSGTLQPVPTVRATPLSCYTPYDPTHLLSWCPQTTLDNPAT